MKKISEFLSENFQFLVAKFSMYLNRRVFVMSYQKPFVFSVSVFCYQICTLKLNLRPKVGLIYIRVVSIVK